MVERVFGDLDFWIYGVPFFYHTGSWKFLLAPGIEDGDLGTEFLLRVGGEYAFRVEGWEIGPGADIDLIDGDQVLVVGVAIARGC